MGWEANDIQFNDDALGIGRALRLVADPNTRISFSQDSDNADITIVTYSPGESTTVSRLIKTSSFEVGRAGEVQAQFYLIDASAGNIDITMPLTALNDKIYSFVRIDGSANTVTFLSAIGTEDFDGIPGSYNMMPSQTLDWFTDYTNWLLK
jgi:hypothetical protein